VLRLLTRALPAALVLTLLPPVGQVQVFATPVTLLETIEDLPEADEARAVAPVPFGDSRSEPVEAPLTFNALGITSDAQVDGVRVRTSLDGETWTAWEELSFIDASDGPDPGTVEDREATDAQATEPLWVGEAAHVQVEVDGGDVEDVEVVVIDAMGSSGGPVQRHREVAPASAEASPLPMVSRAQWGADESLTRRAPSYAKQVHLGVVHHTAHTSSAAVANGYSPAEAAGIMRAMHRYHAQTLGWGDLGYNVVVDRFGTVYEGRAGGFDRAVIGAHARNYNTGSFGVAVIGSFGTTLPSSAAVSALTQVIGVKSAIHGIDPAGWTNAMSDGVWRPTVVGHRDIGQTTCPGRIQELLPNIRSSARTQVALFEDVPQSSPHWAAIMSLAAMGVTNGCAPNAFCPQGVLTRAQAASFVARGLSLEGVAGTQFRDVRADSVHAPAINAMVQRGWLVGYPDGRFRPHERLTRAQLATLLARALDLPLDGRAPNPYPDVTVSSTHGPGIVALASVGVRGNCGGGRFCPNDDAKRDSTASFVNMTLNVR
jgi:hypothetical protein